MSLVIGIDIGTSGVRAMAVDPAGRVTGEARAALPAPQRDGARIVQDAALWWQAADEALLALGRAVDLSQVGAIAVDGTSGTMLAIDAAGSAARRWPHVQ